MLSFPTSAPSLVRELTSPGTPAAFARAMRLVFDQGTILLPEPEAASALADLPGALWDPRVGALRLPARFHERLLAELRRRGVRFEDDVAGTTDNLPALRPSDLRPFQEAALAAWA